MIPRLRITTPDDLVDYRFSPWLIPDWLFTRVLIVETADGERAWMFAFRLLPLLQWRWTFIYAFEPGVDASLWTGRPRELIGWQWPWRFRSWRREIITGAWNDTADAS